MDDKKAKMLREQGYYLSVPKGCSMKPMLKSQENVVEIVPMKTPLKRYDLALYFRPTTNQYVLHRILAVNEKYYIFYGDNCWRKEIIPKEAVIGVARQFRRNDQWIPVTNQWYQLYVHLWCDFLPLRRSLFWVRDKIQNSRRRHYEK